MKILPQLGSNPSLGAGVPKSRLQQILQIQQSAGSDSERRAMLKIIQDQIAGEQLQHLAAHIPKVKAEPSSEQSEDEVTNEHGDTLIISDAARQTYETTADTAASSSSGSSGSSSSASASAE